MGAIERVFRGRRGGQERPVAAIVAGLWKNGEQGVWYDPSDLSTMFQDAAGTLPVYAPGQGQVDPPVGLWLDKRPGLVRGAELNTGATFAGWTTQAGWSIDGNGVASAASVSGGAALLRNLSLRQNTFYEITVTCTSLTNGSFFVRCGFDTVSGNISSAGTYTFRLLRGSNAFVYVVANSGLTGVFSAISVRELPGNHAYQTTTTSRPTLSARYNLITATEFANGITDSGSKGGLISASALTGYAGAIAFGYDGSTSSYIYKVGSIASTLMRISVVVRMDDGGAPAFGSATGISTLNDFVLAVRGVGIAPSSYVVNSIGGGLYRVTAEANSGSGTFDNNGVLKYGANSPRTFKVTAFDLRAANDGVGLPPYQRVVDASTYDTAGFPLYLSFDGVDDWMQTASIDFSGTDKVVVWSSLRKLSDSVLQATVVELSQSSTGNPGTFWLTTPWATSSGAGFRSKGTSIAAAFSDTTPAVHESACLTGVADIALGAVRLSKNKVQLALSNASQGSGNYGNYPLYIGRRGGTSLPFNGRLYSLLVRGAATPDATIAKVERYLNSKARAY